jgi:hypothetical protein
MKIIKQSDPTFELLQTDWWVGELLECEVCKTKFQIERSDAPLLEVCKTKFQIERSDAPLLNDKRSIISKEKDRTMARFNCPRCDKGVWAHFSEAPKKLLPVKISWWQKLIRDF